MLKTKAGKIAAYALINANTFALYSLSKCDICGISSEQANGMSKDEYYYYCDSCGSA
jgi:hypothetical protein